MVDQTGIFAVIEVVSILPTELIDQFATFQVKPASFVLDQFIVGNLLIINIDIDGKCQC